jgi:hypothetical protein
MKKFCHVLSCISKLSLRSPQGAGKILPIPAGIIRKVHPSFAFPIAVHAHPVLPPLTPPDGLIVNIYFTYPINEEKQVSYPEMKFEFGDYKAP